MISSEAKDLRIVLFGATGRTGRLLLQRALRLGHDVSAYVRDPARMEIKHDHLHVVRGDVLDPLSVHWAIAGAEAVRHILDGMETHRVRRIVVLSAAGALHERAGFFVGTVGLGLARLVVPGVYAEHRKMLETLRRRNLDWTAVRPVVLTDGPPTGRYRVVTEGIPRWGFRISRADVADFMIQQLTSDALVKKMTAI